MLGRPICLPFCALTLALLAGCSDTGPTRPTSHALPTPPTPPAVPLDGPHLLWTFPLNSQSFGAASIADVNADGINDVAFATYFGDASVHVLSGNNGHQLWAYHDPNPDRDDCYDASCRFMTESDHLRLVVPCSSGCKVLCFDAADGRLLWSNDLGEGECTDTPPSISDADTDGSPDITVGTFRGRLHVLSSTGSTLRTFDLTQGAVQSCPIVQDINGDRVPDFLAAGWLDFSLHAINGQTRADLWTLKTGDHIYHGPSMGTFAGPMGKPFRAFAIASYDGKVYAVKGDSGAIQWTVAPGDRYFMSPTAMVELNNDGRDSVIAASQRITVIDSNGKIAWSVPASNWDDDTVTRGVSIADLNGDGRADIAYLTGSGLFRVLDSADGHVIYEYSARAIDARGRPITDCSHGPILADLTGDGHLDAFFVVGGSLPIEGSKQRTGRQQYSRYGTAVCLSGFPGVATPRNSWLTFRHDPQNTGNAATPLPDSLLKHIHWAEASK